MPLSHPPRRTAQRFSLNQTTSSPPLCLLALTVTPFHSPSCSHSLAHYRQCNDTAQSLFTSRTNNTKHVTHFMPRAPHSPHSTPPSCSADLERVQSFKSNRLPPRPRPRNHQCDIQLRYLVGRLDLEHHKRQHRLWRPRRRIHHQAERRRSHYPIEFLHLLRRGRGMDESRTRAGRRVDNRPRIR